MNDKQLELLQDLKVGGNYVLGNTIYSRDGEALGILDGFETDAEKDWEEEQMETETKLRAKYQ